jgi:hypothetical protein
MLLSVSLLCIGVISVYNNYNIHKDKRDFLNDWIERKRIGRNNNKDNLKEEIEREKI